MSSESNGIQPPPSRVRYPCETIGTPKERPRLPSKSRNLLIQSNHLLLHVLHCQHLILVLGAISLYDCLRDTGIIWILNVINW